jgi:hypothetical protein
MEIGRPRGMIARDLSGCANAYDVQGKCALESLQQKRFSQPWTETCVYTIPLHTQEEGTRCLFIHTDGQHEQVKELANAAERKEPEPFARNTFCDKEASLTQGKRSGGISIQKKGTQVSNISTENIKAETVAYQASR